MFRSILTALAVVTFLVTSASAGTIVTDRGSVELSRALFEQRVSTPFLTPLDLVSYGDFPYDIEKEFMAHRLEVCGSAGQLVEHYRSAVGRVAHQTIGARYQELREYNIPEDCIVTVIGEDVEWGEIIIHLVVLSPTGDWIFTQQGNIQYEKVGLTSFEYYEMSVPFVPLTNVGVRQ
ncbi:MAG: hypothetical protein WDZ93_01340 [Candidatus Paceibacterota bacterium]